MHCSLPVDRPLCHKVTSHFEGVIIGHMNKTVNMFALLFDSRRDSRVKQGVEFSVELEKA